MEGGKGKPSQRENCEKPIKLDPKKCKTPHKMEGDKKADVDLFSIKINDKAA